MSETTLLVDVVTPERRVWRGRARMLVARGVEGEVGVLPGHIPFVTPLVDGDVRLHGAVRSDDDAPSVDDATPADTATEALASAAARGPAAGTPAPQPGDLVINCRGGFLIVDGRGARILADTASLA